MRLAGVTLFRAHRRLDQIVKRVDRSASLERCQIEMHDNRVGLAGGVHGVEDFFCNSPLVGLQCHNGCVDRVHDAGAGWQIQGF